MRARRTDDLAAATEERVAELKNAQIWPGARAHYRRRIEHEPWLIEQMIDGGRGREVIEAGST